MCLISLIWLIPLVQEKYLYFRCCCHKTRHGHLGSKQCHSFILPPWNTSMKSGHSLRHKNTFFGDKIKPSTSSRIQQAPGQFCHVRVKPASFSALILSGDSGHRAHQNHCQPGGFPKTISRGKHVVFGCLNLHRKQEYWSQSYSIQKLLESD